ncbi:hypothetical protein SLG_17870 [Sphingobium sp. SYK-6]|uniref:ComF family protein n=1 Tax=Sphingobium sp. (strain NBRC 103272 / SYK-6) TaxID=627192 RepID=UPI0002277238|nr:ComF family protein [Sphingobium sp. SYK-6]BAK66462.1 hypothetical protein SLG_17870 [Sphingobium sp. SYK-6]
MGVFPFLRSAVRPVLDYALPPRCPACGVIVAEPETLCAACWSTIDFLGEPLCTICGSDLPHGSGEGIACGACLATPPPYDRARAVMRYGDVARTMAHRLKYGRRVSLARFMAMHMARLLEDSETADRLLLPVPLHRWRIWSRGFNQAALIAGHMRRETGIALELDLLRRVRNTPPLHALSRRERSRIVSGAFVLAPGARAKIEGRRVVLVDDIWTTGATATACARLLKRNGAARVEILCWTRVSQADD